MNWGNRLVLVFVVFGLGMGYLVYRSMNTNFELVEKDYYKQELRYQNVIDDHQQANALSAPARLEEINGQLTLQLPEEMKHKSLTGEVYFYCAYDKTKDKRFELKADSLGRQVLPPGAVSAGNYTAKISWKNGEQSFYSEQKLFVH
ncbi:MAG: FixH family protein [Chitinophagales bacterium]|nr:FixH family protein [Chitinophagales bacterium]